MKNKLEDSLFGVGLSEKQVKNRNKDIHIQRHLKRYKARLCKRLKNRETKLITIIQAVYEDNRIMVRQIQQVSIGGKTFTYKLKIEKTS